MLGMCVGEKRRITVPSDLAYGDKGKEDLVPPGATLLFEVELWDIVTKEAIALERTNPDSPPDWKPRFERDKEWRKPITLLVREGVLCCLCLCRRSLCFLTRFLSPLSRSRRGTSQCRPSGAAAGTRPSGSRRRRRRRSCNQVSRLSTCTVCPRGSRSRRRRRRRSCTSL